MFLSKDILGLIFIELQFKRDADNFRLVCWSWADAGRASQRQRKSRWKNSCSASYLSNCESPGEFACERCATNGLCVDDDIKCIKCYRRLCPDCCGVECAICIDCSGGKRLAASYIYCNTCAKVIQLGVDPCVRLLHEYHYLGLTWMFRFQNLPR